MPVSQKILVIQPVITDYRRRDFESFPGDRYSVRFIAERRASQEWGNQEETALCEPVGLLGVRFNWRVVLEFLRYSPDIVFTYSDLKDLTQYLLSILCYTRNIKYIVHTHGVYKKKGASLRISQALIYCLKWFGTEFLLYSEVCRKGLPGSNKRQYNVIENVVRYPPKSLHNLYNPSSLGILYVGRFRDWTALSMLIGEFASSQVLRCFKLHLLGGGEYLTQAERLAKSLSISDRVCFYGPTFEIGMKAQIAAECRFAVYPGDAGLSVLDYCALRLPMVMHSSLVHHAGPEPANLLNSVAAELFNRGDKSSFRRAMEKMVSLSCGECRCRSLAAFELYRKLSRNSFYAQFADYYIKPRPL